MIRLLKRLNPIFVIILSFFDVATANKAIDHKICGMNEDGPMLYTKHDSKPEIGFYCLDDGENKGNANVVWHGKFGFLVRIETIQGQPEYNSFIWACRSVAFDICLKPEVREKWQQLLTNEKYSQSSIDKFFELHESWALSSEQIEQDFSTDNKLEYSWVVFLNDAQLIKSSSNKSINNFINSDQLIHCKGHFTQMYFDKDQGTRVGRLLFIKCYGPQLESLRELMVDQKDQLEQAIMHDKDGKEFALLKIQLKHDFPFVAIDDVMQIIEKKFGIIN